MSMPAAARTSRVEADVAAIAGQLQHVAGLDLRPGGVLEDLQEPQGADDVVGLASGPAVPGGVVAYHDACSVGSGRCRRRMPA